MGTKERRNRVLNVWLRFRKIWPDWKILPGVLAQNRIPVRIILGKFDTIISPKRFERRPPEWDGFVWTIAKAGHGNLVTEAAKEPDFFGFSG